jgi:hypothetical protein
MVLDIDLVVDAYFVEATPDLYKARQWAGDVASVRVVENGRFAYGAVDQWPGTIYFDEGDWLVKVRPFGQIVVVKADRLEESNP